MDHTTAGKQAEIDHNLQCFLEMESALIPGHKGKHALLRHGRVIGYYDSPLEAQSAGMISFPDEMFSVQEVGQDPEDLGLFSHAFDLWPA